MGSRAGVVEGLAQQACSLRRFQASMHLLLCTQTSTPMMTRWTTRMLSRIPEMDLVRREGGGSKMPSSSPQRARWEASLPRRLRNNSAAAGGDHTARRQRFFWQHVVQDVFCRPAWIATEMCQCTVAENAWSSALAGRRIKRMRIDVLP